MKILTTAVSIALLTAAVSAGSANASPKSLLELLSGDNSRYSETVSGDIGDRSGKDAVNHDTGTDSGKDRSGHDAGQDAGSHDTGSDHASHDHAGGKR